MSVTIHPTDRQQQSEFAKLFQAQEKEVSLEEGSLIKGRIVQLTQNFVIIDVGLKSEGKIAAAEFKDSEGNLTIKVGDEVEVLLESLEADEGLIALSKERADIFKAWDTLVKIQEEGGFVEGVVVGKVKGGLNVDVGVKAFLPGSQIDVRPVRSLDRYMGKRFKFKIIKLNKRRGNIVLSRKEAMDKEGGDSVRDVVLPDVKEGETLKGRVKNVTDFGAFVDLGGFDGLLHVTDMSWGRVSHPSDLFKIGDTVSVVILKVDQENKKISLGYKQLTDDPWTKVESLFPVGSKVKGKVTSLADYGAFVELAAGIEGLVHISEISWNKALKNVASVVSPGQEVEAIVLDCDVGARRIALGMKQLKPNPWDVLEKDFSVGSKVSGTVRHLTDFGLFLDCGVEVDGLVHISDLSWVQNFRHPQESFKKGETVEAVVLHIDREQSRFSLGLKQLQDNPWEMIKKKYPKGAKTNGVVERVGGLGAWVQLEPQVTGLLPTGEDAPQYKPGDKVMVEVAVIEEEGRKFHLKAVN